MSLLGNHGENESEQNSSIKRNNKETVLQKFRFVVTIGHGNVWLIMKWKDTLFEIGTTYSVESEITLLTILFMWMFVVD